MAIAHQGSGATFQTTGADPWNVPFPATVQPQWLLRTVLFFAGQPTVTPPALNGWTLVQTTLNGVSYKLAQYWKIASGSETGTEAFDLSAVAGGLAKMDAFSGVDPNNPLVGTIQAGTADAAGNNAVLVFPSLGGTIPAGAWVVRTAGTVLAANIPHSHTPPASPVHTEDWDAGGAVNASNFQGAISSSRYELPSTGTVAGANGSASTIVVDIEQTFGLLPAGARRPRIGMIG